MTSASGSFSSRFPLSVMVFKLNLITINLVQEEVHSPTFCGCIMMCRHIPFKTRCVRTTRMSPPWLLRRLANVSPFFNSLSNRLRITNYYLRSVTSSLLIFTRFIQGNTTFFCIASTNLDVIRNLQHLHMNKKFYTYKTWSVTHHCNSKYQKSSQYLKE